MKDATRSRTVETLRNDLYDVFDGLKAKTLEPKHAKEMNNSAGKMLASAKAQLEYARDRKVKPNIPFLSC